MSQGEMFEASPVEVLESDAVFSPCRTWRYSLTRSWVKREQGLERKRLVVIGLNPSTADETQDDPTIRRCIGFAKSWGFDGLLMVNLFAFRSTDPRGLPAERDRAIGPENDHYLSAITKCRQTLCAWGAHGELHGRAKEVFLKLANAGRALLHLGVTKAGHPSHPLYIPASRKPLPFMGDAYIETLTRPGREADEIR